MEEQPQPTDPPTNSGGWVRCVICNIWCNCLKQYEGEKGHVQGKKHTKNLKKQQQSESAGTKCRMDPPSMGATMQGVSPGTSPAAEVAEGSAEVEPEETVAGQSQNCGRMLPFGQPNMTSFGQPTMMLQFPQQHVLPPMQPMPLVPYFDGVPPGQEAWNQSNWLSHQSDGQQWSDQHQEW